MIDIQEETQRPIHAFLIGKDIKANPLSELRGLVFTLGMNILEEYILTRIEPTAQFGIGTGKAAEIAQIAKEIEAECIIFDFEISPTQQRNWERLAHIPVFDRQEVILKIFASRARTKEAVLQVNLARLQYSLPRLAHSYGDMARQRGGNYGSKGSGETQLELDRRGVLTKIAQIKKELAVVIQERETMRKHREKIPLPTCALVGYTNAGKSSLLNALTDSEVFVEDKLFATLDPTTRKLALEGSQGILLSDTVGFISNLPHNLIDAFKATLEEANRAQLLLLVLDSSDSEVLSHYQVVTQALSEINALNKDILIVLNKIDALPKKQTDILPLQHATEMLSKKFPKALWVSAKTKEGFEDLKNAIAEKLYGKKQTFYIPLERQEILQEIRKNGVLLSSYWKEHCIKITARVQGKLLQQLQQFTQETKQ
ncbi:MAG: GTPase HflX [Spirochaetaceae bacterium]|nr:GTPase HflX [Spirochaetaceae bacterium]